MLEVSRQQLVASPPEQVWPDIADAGRFAEWYAFCDAVEEPEDGVRVLVGSWGSQRSAVTTQITVADAPQRFAWRHTDETLDGRPAPTMSMETTVEITLTPQDGGTMVEVTSRQAAAGRWQGLAMRLLGRRKVAGMLQQSLTVLAARHAA